ncbi:hypothetical protein KFE25_003351 [Diacronema lutheri]|uniref:Uncharacterized protein n=2 Tax=Diacronema lutheri TaxID=2081491 RepID=A0A8J6CE82_DIALT|nr:hypothetical protein KFE25_003351 [Diacronema lutheri]
MATSVVRAIVLCLLLARGAHTLRPFESGKVEQLGAEACWAKRQFEKEEYENLRFEHLACVASRDKACNCAARAAPLLSALVARTASANGRRGGKASLGPVEGQCAAIDDSRAPLADRKTGLCTWRALSHNPRGTWVSKEEAAAHFGRSPFPDYDAALHARKPFCRDKTWYSCPAWKHSREWLPEVVTRRQCTMTYLTPPMLHKLTGKHLRLLLHGSSFFKATYRSFVCLFDEWIRWEEHHEFAGREASGAEVWTAQFGDALTIQLNYRDGDFNQTSRIVAGSRHHEQDEFDMIVTNFGGGGYSLKTYAQVAAERGFSGPVVFTGNPCARCCAQCQPDGPERDAGLARCSESSVQLMSCARGAQLIPISFCEMTIPFGGYRATWAPEGRIRHAGEPHLCSPGPDDQLANVLMHVLASYYRK